MHGLFEFRVDRTWLLGNSVEKIRDEWKDQLLVTQSNGTLETIDSPVPYPRYDIDFEAADDTLILICKTSKNGSCAYTGSLGELSISGWDDDRLEDYSVTLGET